MAHSRCSITSFRRRRYIISTLFIITNWNIVSFTFSEEYRNNWEKKEPEKAYENIIGKHREG